MFQIPSQKWPKIISIPNMVILLISTNSCTISWTYNKKWIICFLWHSFRIDNKLYVKIFFLEIWIRKFVNLFCELLTQWISLLRENIIIKPTLFIWDNNFVESQMNGKFGAKKKIKLLCKAFFCCKTICITVHD